MFTHAKGKKGYILEIWLNCPRQRCGSGRFLTGSESDFQKRPDLDPDPDPNKFSANFFLEIFFL
jgi:hypothetical protein